jgi:hypothetical protein
VLARGSTLDRDYDVRASGGFRCARRSRSRSFSYYYQAACALGCEEACL